MTRDSTRKSSQTKSERLEQFAFWLITATLAIYFSGGILPPLLHLIGLDTLGDLFFAAYSHTCHQIPERSFLLCDTQFGLCARCIGFYGGLLMGAIYCTVKRGYSGPPPLLVLGMSLIMLADVAFSLSPDNRSGNWFRLALALPTGFLLAAWAMAKLRASSRESS